MSPPSSRPAGASGPPGEDALTGRRWWLASAAVLALALAATVPTTGDLGLTWDEPAYRYSQLISAHWWRRLAGARTGAEVRALVEPNALLYYWPYARFGRNFHPPLAGQLSLATHALFGRWMKDIPSRRLASVFEFALTVTLAFGFLARRYGPWVGGVAAGSLLLMPRLYGEAHIAETDVPGLLIWAAAAVAFWKGLHEPHARRWRVAVGVLAGLAFVEKMAAVFVLVPLLGWLVVGHLPRTLSRRGGRANWADGLLTLTAQLIPLGIAAAEILRLSRRLLPPKQADLFQVASASPVPGAILAMPLLVWAVRRLLGRLFPHHPVWGAERPALEIATAVLGFAPVIGWLGNPAWWRETLPRLAHYYMLSTARRGALPDIQILYFGQAYEYALPWHNAWVLIAITVPAGILAAALAGLVYALRHLRRDRLPLFFLLNLVTLPVLRMLPTPAHDGVRLFLPTFFFVAACAGWGAVWVADGLARLLRPWAPEPDPFVDLPEGPGSAGTSLEIDTPVAERGTAAQRAGRLKAGCRALSAALVLGTAAWQLVEVHPFELSYYNELIGGPRGAWESGFELSYWYDAFNPRTIAELNARLPRGAKLDFLNDKSSTALPVFTEQQDLGHLRGDLVLAGGDPYEFPYVWLLTHDSKASAFTRLLFAMKPWYALEPRQLDGARVVTVADPEAVTRAWALQLLLDGPDLSRRESPAAPAWVHRYAPWLGRLWGEGLTKSHKLGVNGPVFVRARQAPNRLRAAARKVASGQPLDGDPDALELRRTLTRYDRGKDPQGQFLDRLLRFRPQALLEAVEILIARPKAILTVMTRYSYIDPARIGGYLDREFAAGRP